MGIRKSLAASDDLVIEVQAAESSSPQLALPSPFAPHTVSTTASRSSRVIGLLKKC
jgi:hypothetical protein